MSNLMYQCSAQVFTHNLKNLSAILKVAARDAKTRGIDPSVLLNARLAPDMYPLVRQVQIATDYAKGCSARLAGVESPELEDTETTFAELEARTRRVLAFIRSLKAAQFTDSESREIVLPLSIGTLTFNGANYLNGWALPTFYFHYSATYNILRHNGVQLGKLDFLGAAPGMQMSGEIAKLMAEKTKNKR